MYIECDRIHQQGMRSISFNFLELSDRFQWEIFLEDVECDRSYLLGIN